MRLVDHQEEVLGQVVEECRGRLTGLATVEVARSIIRETFLSFLGLGIQPPTPSWGLMLAEGRAYILTVWWLSTLPGVAIFLSALSINLVGDALRDLSKEKIKAAILETFDFRPAAIIEYLDLLRREIAYIKEGLNHDLAAQGFAPLAPAEIQGFLAENVLRLWKAK